MAGPYVCPFDEFTAKIALQELYEDPLERESSVETFREWIKQQPHISCPTDDRFLLAFLRARKFSQLEARTLLENYLERRSKYKRWFANIDPSEPGIQKVIDDGPFIVLPKRDNLGRKVLILRAGCYDVTGKRYKADDIFRAAACVLDHLYWDETTQVHGTVVVKDFTGYSLKNHNATPVEDRKAFLQTWKKHYPARIKAIHMYNLGTLGDIILGIAKLIMPAKIQKRIHQHGKILESLYAHIPEELLPEEYLPDDYTGPNAGSCQHLVDQLKRDIVSGDTCQQIKMYSNDKYYLDTTKRPDHVPQASFRKLSVQ